MTQIAKVEQAQIVQAPVTPMDLIQRAAAQGASIEQMAQLFELKLRVEADEARKAFNVAMADFKKSPPRIVKNKHVKHNDFWHATLDEVVAKITPALSAVGIRHRWDVDQSKAPQITVTCVLSHEMGHSESTPLTASADTSGAKNAIQAIGSAVTYLQRYTLLAATGLAATGTDDDGNGAGGNASMGDEEFIQWREAINAAADLKSLQSVFANAYSSAKKIGDQTTMADLIKIKDARKSQIGGAR